MRARQTRRQHQHNTHHLRHRCILTHIHRHQHQYTYTNTNNNNNNDNNKQNKVFPIAWTWFYAAMGTAAWLTATKATGAARKTALALYAGQLALNFAWT